MSPGLRDMCCSTTYDIRTVQELLGHKNVNTTMFLHPCHAARGKCGEESVRPHGLISHRLRPIRVETCKRSRPSTKIHSCAVIPFHGEFLYCLYSPKGGKLSKDWVDLAQSGDELNNEIFSVRFSHNGQGQALPVGSSVGTRPVPAIPYTLT